MVLCGTPWSEDSSCISKDGLTIVYLGHDPTEERFGLMTYNVETKTSQLVSSDVYDGKTAAYFQEISLGDGYGVKWIENPVLSEDNLLIAYDSNRRTYEDYLKEVQEYGGEWDESDPKNDHVPYPATDIWVKDLASGEEYLLLKNAGVQFWVGRSLVYMAHDGSSQSNLNIINLDTKEIKQLPEGLIKIVPNSFYISNWEEEVFQLYNVKTDTFYTFPLQEQGLQVIEKEIFAGEDGKEYALITYKDSNQDKEGSSRYFLGVIELETGMKNMYVFPDVINERETAPVSYTHLDVYKRQVPNGGSM